MGLQVGVGARIDSLELRVSGLELMTYSPP